MDDKSALLDWIERDRDLLVSFLQDFIRARSPNPPGDTREAAAFVREFLDRHGLEHRVIAPEETMPNIVASFEGAGDGPHLVLNGHMDVFPVGEDEKWDHDAWGGTLVDGKIFGRGACDMKAGTTASIFTYLYLSRMRERLRGRLTLTAVSDEETFGPWGARYLVDHHSEVRGDCLLNGEPSSPYTIRFGEKGPYWLTFTVRTPGGHGAYTHLSASATKIAAAFVQELETVTGLTPEPPPNVASAIEAGRSAMDEALGKGAGEIVDKVTLNVGRLQGGVKTNMIPGTCRIEADFRLPVGADRALVQSRLEQLLSRYPEVTMEEVNYSEPSYCDPNGPMVSALQRNVEALKGFRPTPIISIGGTDARLWRYMDVPAYVYGPSPTGMGSANEHVDVEEFLHIVRAHVLSAYDYLSGE